MNPTTDILVIGGGAAGLCAAIFAAQSVGDSRQVILLEGSKQCGTKILVSGGTRCNVTHHTVSPDDFNGSRNIVRNVLAAFPVEATCQWFASLGVELKQEDTGKLFPVSDSARSVRDALENRCRELGVIIRTDMRVRQIRRPTELTPCFHVEHEQGTIEASSVVLACGGRSLPRSGSDGSGWALARELGHTVTPTYQALVPLVLDTSFFHAQLSGIALDVELSTFVGGKRIDHRSGAMLWTHFGISGPVAMDASRHWVMAHETGQQPQLKANLIGPGNFETVERHLIGMAADRPRTSILNTLSGRLPERILATLLNHAGIEPSTRVGQVPREARRAFVHLLTALPLPVIKPRGWEYAEVTSGGVPLNEINYRTMESRVCPGLYLVGEILDCDGRIGGFNFQWAWSSGKVAGTAMRS